MFRKQDYFKYTKIIKNKVMTNEVLQKAYILKREIIEEK